MGHAVDFLSRLVALAGDQQDIAGPQPRNRRGDGLATVADLRCIGTTAQNLGPDGGGVFADPNAAVNSEAEMFYEVAFVTAADGSVALIGDEGKSFHGVGRLVGEWRTVAKVRAGNCRG